MNDEQIVELFWQRSESAISETATKYGAYCTKIAMNILNSKPDADECVNDSYLNVWNNIPPTRPNVFQAFLGRITRNLSLNRYTAQKTQKRGGAAILLSELEDCLPAAQTLEQEVDSTELLAQINAFLLRLEKPARVMFVRRYWYGDSMADIAAAFKISESGAKSRLFRIRQRLKEQLEKEGIIL